MQARLPTNIVAIVGIIVLLCASSQAHPLLDRSTATTEGPPSHALESRHDGPSRNEYEQNVRRSPGAHESFRRATGQEDASRVVPIYNLANRRDNVPANPSPNGLEQPAVVPVVKPAAVPKLLTPSTNPPAVPVQAANPSSTPSSTSTLKHRTLSAGSLGRLRIENPIRTTSHSQHDPSLKFAVRTPQIATNEFLQARSQNPSPRRRRVAPVAVTQPFRAPVSAPFAHPANPAGRLAHVHHLYAGQPARHSHQSHEHAGSSGISKPQTQSSWKSLYRFPFSFLGRFQPQSVFASHQRPLGPARKHEHTKTSSHETGMMLGIAQALRIMLHNAHGHLIPLFLGRRPSSPYISHAHTHVPYTKFVGPPHRPDFLAQSKAQKHPNAGTIKMASNSLTHSIPIPMAFSLSPEICSPLATECGCITKDLASRLIQSYPAGVPASTSLITETVNMMMDGVEYRATIELKFSRSVNGKMFKDILGLLVSVKKELGIATHGQGFGAVTMKGDWLGVNVEAVWTYYRFEHGVAKACS